MRQSVVSILWLAMSACSFTLDWDYNRLPCDESGECFDGYSCLVNECVEDRSVKRGETCNADIQCKDRLICGFNPRVCREPCATAEFYTNQGQCDDGFFCEPYFDVLNDRYVGQCVPSECSSDGDCDGAFICVVVNESAGACLVGCDPFNINCGSTSPQYCQPVGAIGSQRFVCLDAATTGGDVGDACSPVDDPCATDRHCYIGAGSFTGVCAEYCDPNQMPPTCTSAPTCCLGTASTPITYGVCANSCLP